MTEPLSKVDSAVEGVSPVEEKKKPRQSTIAAEGVYKLEDLGMHRRLHTPTTRHMS